MPFTLSHAAAALPFGKLKPVWPALVIGTFAPDLQYFIWVSDEDRSGHHFPEVLLFTLPLALLLLWIFERRVKAPMIELLPSGLTRRLQDKLQPLAFGGWRRFGSIVLWIAIGIATHLFWDAFTHGHDWIANHFSVLNVMVDVPFHPPVRMFKVLQQASTLLGLLALAIWFVAWYRRTPPVPSAKVRELSPFRKLAVVFTMALVAALAGYSYGLSRLAEHEPPLSPQFVVVTIFEAITLAFCLEVLIYSLVRAYNSPSGRTPAIRMDEQRS
jgi:Domain of unknown function (DUF4184)